MKELLGKYIIELAIAATIGTFIAVRKIINWIIKIKFNDRMDEFKCSLEKLDLITKGLQESSKDLVNNVENVITKVGEFMVTIEDFKYNMQKDIDKRFEYWEKRFDKLEAKVDGNSTALTAISTMHNSIYEETNKKLKQ